MWTEDKVEADMLRIISVNSPGESVESVVKYNSGSQLTRAMLSAR